MIWNVIRTFIGWKPLIQRIRLHFVNMPPGHQSANGKAGGCCEERQESAQTHLTWQVWSVLGSAWNAQYPTPRCQSQPCPHFVWPVYTFGTASVFEALYRLGCLERLTRRRQTKQCYDRRARPLSTLHANQPVYFQHPPRKGWTRGNIVRRIGPRSYIVKSIDGSTYKRNRVHIRPFTSRDRSHSEPQH